MIKFELKHLEKKNRVVDVETVLQFLEFLDFNVSQTAQRQSMLFGWIVTLRVRLPGMWLLQGVSHLCHRVYITCCALC